jgi:hypothetical protein
MTMLITLDQGKAHLRVTHDAEDTDIEAQIHAASALVINYLKDAAEAARPMGPGARGEAELVLADPGPEAVGYRLDVCQRESATILRCAQGPGR